MFDTCIKMATTPNVSGWDVSNITTMASFMELCRDVTTAPDVSGWNTSNCTNFSYAFNNLNDCTTTIDMSGWDTSNGTTFFGMFAGSGSSGFKANLADMDFTSATDVRDMVTISTGGPSYSNAEVDAWLIQLDTEVATPAGFQFDYDSMIGNPHLDVNRSGAATTAVSNLIANGAVRTGSY